MFKFQILSQQQKNKARVGRLETPHGNLITPELAFVATEGEIKAIPKNIMPSLPINLIIVNTFHLWVKNIINCLAINNQCECLNQAKQPPIAIHDLANFQKPIMSDSGGFQVFSMGFGKSHGIGKIGSIFPEENKKLQITDKLISKTKPQNDKNNPLKITEEGVTFPFNDRMMTLTPELSIRLQQKIGADIIFAFDECTSPLNSYEYTKQAMERTHRWLIRCLHQFKKSKILNSQSKTKLGSNDKKLLNCENRPLKSHPLTPASQALFAIVQGGYFEDLRKQSAKFIAKQDVSGFGIGGSLGKTKEDMYRVLQWIIPYLPMEKPRHLLGIGQVKDIFEAVERGVDLFDCVIPTREARHQVIYTKKGKVSLRKMKYYRELIDDSCSCLACKEKLTWTQLAELFSKKDKRAFFYATIHNIQFYADLVKKIRKAILVNQLSKLKETYSQYY